MFTITVNGKYPVHPDEPKPRHLEQAFKDFAANTIDDAQLTKALQRASVDAIAEMIYSGVEILSDGLIRKYDPETTIFSRLGGIRIVDNQENGHRDKVTYIVESKVHWKEPITLNEYRFIIDRAPVSVRPSLTGPFTLFSMCKDNFYKDESKALLKDLAISLNTEMRELKQAGAEWVLVEEPAIDAFLNQPELLVEIFNILLEGVYPSTMLGLEAADISPVVKLLPEMFWNGISINLVNNETNRKLIENSEIMRGLVIQLGILDSENERIESVSELKRAILHFANFHDPHRLWVAPNKGFTDAIQRDTAFLKLQNLSQAVALARRVVASTETPGGEIPT